MSNEQPEVSMETKRKSFIWVWSIILLIVIIGLYVVHRQHHFAPQPTPQPQSHVQTEIKSLSYAKWLPDPVKSPGAVFPNVTAEQVSVPGYASSVRNVSTKEKEEVFKEYGITHHDPGEYEVDHLISLELGGSNDIKNLWPEPYHGEWNAHMKDALEDRLHAMVVHHEIGLQEAQHEISTDWIAAYKKYVHP